MNNDFLFIDKGTFLTVSCVSILKCLRAATRKTPQTYLLISKLENQNFDDVTDAELNLISECALSYLPKFRGGVKDNLYALIIVLCQKS